MSIQIAYPDMKQRFVDEKGYLTPSAHRMLVDLIRRTGGQTTNAIAEVQEQAARADAAVVAIKEGAPTGYSLNPTDPLGYTLTSATQATITVAGHTRTGAGAALVAGSVAAAANRGETYFVYYDDAGNAGGTQTFLATQDASILSAAGRRYIGPIAIPPIEATLGGLISFEGIVVP